MPRYSLAIKATIHAKSDTDAQTLQKKVDALLTKHAKMLLATESIVLDKIAVDPKITRES